MLLFAFAAIAQMRPYDFKILRKLRAAPLFRHTVSVQLYINCCANGSRTAGKHDYAVGKTDCFRYIVSYKYRSFIAAANYAGNIVGDTDARLVVKGGEGLVKQNVEQTIDTIGRMASEGMAETDKKILQLMQEA